jgi:cytochrome c oxidase subunit 2
VAALVSVATSGCAGQRGWLPGDSDNEFTNHTGTISSLWNGSWIAALLVGLIVWVLMIWCIAVYRRRAGDSGLPVQLRYNLPVEMVYTLVPLFIVGVLFFYTERDQSFIEERNPDTVDQHIQVVGKQWAWDFNYIDEDVYETSVHVQQDGSEPEEELPTLYLPVGQSIEFQLNTRDVAHSFWVPAFLYKKDLIPDRDNYYQVTPQVEGTYVGRCAELCGEYHSDMLFQVKVVSEDEFAQQMDALRDRGQTGQLEVELGRVDGNNPGDDPRTPEGEEDE